MHEWLQLALGRERKRAVVDTCVWRAQPWKHRIYRGVYHFENLFYFIKEEKSFRRELLLAHRESAAGIELRERARKSVR